MRSWKRTWLLVLVALALGVVSSCTPAAEAPKPAPAPPKPEPTVVRIGMAGSPKTFNPLRTTDDNSLMAMELMWAPLAWWNDSLEFSPHLAKSWEVSKDGLTWTFVLKDIKWSDGQPLVAEDVRMTWKLLSHKATGGIWVGSLRNIKGVNEYFDGKANDIPGIEVVDQKTLRVHLVSPAPERMFLQDIHYFILPSHILKDYTPEKVNDAPFWNKPNVSIGPYIFEEYKTDQYIRLKKNPTYFLGAPKIDEVVIRLGTSDTLLAQLEKGELDFMSLPAQEVARFKKLPNITIFHVKGSSYNQLLHINGNKPYLADKRVRQAMAYAIDREGISKTVYEGYASVVVSPSKADWAIPKTEPEYKVDLTKAKQLLQAAKWNSKQELTLVASSSSLTGQRTAAIIRESLAAVGMKVNVELTDSPTMFSRAQEGKYDLVVVGWSFNGDPNETARVYWSKNMPPAGWNVMGYKNARVDQLYEQGRVTLDQTKRVAIYQEIQSIINDELPTIVLVRLDKVLGVSSKLKGVNPRKYRKEAFPQDMWNIQEWTITK